MARTVTQPVKTSHESTIFTSIRRAIGRHDSIPPPPIEPLIEGRDQAGSDDLLNQFIREVTAVRGQVHQARSRDEVVRLIRDICTGAGAGELALSGGTLLAEMNFPAQLPGLDLTIFRATEYGPEKRDELVARLASCGAGLTGVEYAIAETGTIVLSSDEQESLLVSLLPPIHIALVFPKQVEPTLAAVIGKLKANLMGRAQPCLAANFITGPSRTSDVELTLSIGVHGPKELHLILLTCQ